MLPLIDVIHLHSIDVEFGPAVGDKFLGGAELGKNIGPNEEINFIVLVFAGVPDNRKNDSLWHNQC